MGSKPLSDTSHRSGTIYLPDGDGQLTRTSLDSVSLWARHPRHGRLIAIHSWKDVRRLQHAGRSIDGGWDHRVVVLDADAGAGEAEVSDLLDSAGNGSGVETPENMGVGGARMVLLDEDAARGRQRIIAGSTADKPIAPLSLDDQTSASLLKQGTLERLAELVWLEEASLTRGQPELQRRGVKSVAQRLFGSKAHRNVVAGLGQALVRRGATGGFGNRYRVVVLATLGAPFLSADRIADILGWPFAPSLPADPSVALGVEQMLGPLDEFRRHQLLEALALDDSQTGVRFDLMEWLDLLEDDDASYDSATHQAYADRLLTVVRAHNPEALGALAIGPSLQMVVSNQPPHQVVLVGALTSACIAAGIGLPTPGQGWSRYVEDLVSVATPPPIRWVWLPEVAALHGQPVPGADDVELALPFRPEELRSWGNDMNNCIGSYGHRVNRGSCILLGVIRGGRLIGNVSIERPINTLEPGDPGLFRGLDGPYDPTGGHEWRVTGLAGRFNDDLPRDITTPLSAMLDPFMEGLPETEPVVRGALAPRGIMASTADVLPATTGRRSDAPEPSVDLEDRVVGRPRGARRLRRGRPRGGTIKPLVPATMPPDEWGNPHARAVLCSLDNRDRFRVTDEVMAALVPDLDPPVAQRLLLMVAFRNQPPQIADVVALVAEFDPMNAWLRPGSVDVVRTNLMDLVAGQRSALDLWDDTWPLEVEPDVSAAVRDVLLVWGTGDAHTAMARQVWLDGSYLKVVVGRATVGVLLNASGDFHVTSDNMNQMFGTNPDYSGFRGTIRSMIGTMPRFPWDAAS